MLGNKEAKRRAAWKRRVVIVKKVQGGSKTIPQNCHKKTINVGLVPARVLGYQARGICPSARLRIRRQVAEMLGKKKQASLDIFVEVENMELEYELAFRGDVLLSQVALGEANGLMTFLKLGRSRSAMQALGIRPGVLLEPSAAKLGMLACSGQLGTPLLRETPFLTVGECLKRHLKSSWLKE